MRTPGGALVVAAFVVTCGGLAIGTGAVDGGWLESGYSPGVGNLAAGCAAAACATLFRLRMRVDRRLIELTWGEGAVMFLCQLLPASWVPAAVLVGVGGAQTAISVIDRRRTAGVILRSAAVHTLAATAAVVVTSIGGSVHGRQLSVSTAVSLVAGALTFSVVVACLLAAQLAEPGSSPDRDGGMIQLFVQLTRGRILMLVGNIIVGLLAVAVEQSWLLLFPPLMWLLQQSYGHRLRLYDERLTWQLFSEVTGQLSRLDELGAAAAGIRGALRLFPAAMAEVVIITDGRSRAYVAERDGPVVEVPVDPDVGAGHCASGERHCPSGARRCVPVERARAQFPRLRRLGILGRSGWPRAGPVEHHPFIVEGTQIGELRLCIDPPHRLARRDRLMLAAYGDALAAALHDAATHQELRSIVDRSSYDAVHDPLTGMVNRGALLARGNAVLRRLPPTAPVALLLLDVNHFKEVNNTLGHEAGDELLRVIARRLGAAVRSDGILARLGGDEFALLLTDAVEPIGSGAAADPAGGGASRGFSGLLDHAVGRARRLAEEIAAPTEVCGVVLSVEASVGVVAATAGEIDMTELLRRADIAMYQAKRGTRGVAWYEPAGDEASIDRLALLAELREALMVRDQLTLVLQPAVCLETGHPVAVEALARWRHPRRGWLEPEEFLDAVEHSELVGPFTRYILDAALEIVAGWMAAGIDTPIAVNLCARSLLDRSLADDLPVLLGQWGVPAERLTLEITESVVLSELATVAEVLAALRSVGVRLAVDDFGSGFSSLTFLTRVPVDEVKIDRAFVARMVESAEAAAIVRTTVDLGRRLGLRVVAEGVESNEQRLALIGLGCVVAQGYHFFRPLPPERVALILADAVRDRRLESLPGNRPGPIE